MIYLRFIKNKFFIFILINFFIIFAFFINFPASKNIRSSSMKMDVPAFNDFLVEAKRDADLWRQRHGKEAPSLGFFSNKVKGFYGSKRVFVGVIGGDGQWHFSIKVNELDFYSCELVSDFLFVSNRIRHSVDKKSNWSLVSYGGNSLLFDSFLISELSFSEAYQSFLFKRNDLCNAKSGFADFVLYENVPSV